MAEVFAVLARLIATIPDEEEQLLRLYHIHQTLAESNKDALVGASLRCIVKELPVELLERMEEELCEFISKRIQLSKNKVSLIEALLSLLLAMEENFQSEDVVRGVVLAHIKNEDWNVRKSVIDMYYALVVLKSCG